MPDITLSAAVRSNLLSLQNTAELMDRTQTRLATGNKVNSALDNPSSFFTAQGLNNRASDFANLLDAMSNGIQVLDAANNGLSSITKTLQSMQSTLQQARADSSFQSADYTIDTSSAALVGKSLTLSGGGITGTATIALSGDDAASSKHAALTATTAMTTLDLSAAASDLTFKVNGQTVTLAKGATAGPNGDGTYTAQDVADAINGVAAANVNATVDSGKLVLTSTSTANNGSADSVTVDTFSSGDASQLGFAAQASVTQAGTDGVYSVDELVNKINNNTSVNTAIHASNNGGKLHITNNSATKLNVNGATSTGTIDGTSTDANSIDGNSVRKGLVDQFNTLRDQLDKTAGDASYNGINILNGDDLKITFNPDGTSTIEIQSDLNGTKGTALNSTNLGVDALTDNALDANSGIDALLNKVGDALNEVRSQSSKFGSNLSVVQNRQDFTKAMINTLQTGAANLTLADSNEEAANMVALQTRQQLSIRALSLAGQSDQSILQLLR